jgi:3-deoxy-manno-octulosonate cytidylyltransferase (CMP-KDO synthetase)
MKKIIGVIPARYGSTRFPGKSLANIAGKPMIQHVWENSSKSKLINELYVATDDKRIFDTVNGFWGRAVMTSKIHKSGSDRIGEVVKNIKCDIVVNIQGDEPFINPLNIDKAIRPLMNDSRVQVSTLCTPIKHKEEINNPNVVKVVTDKNRFALYFSRHSIPFNRDNTKDITYYKHIGLYVFRKDYLMKFIKLKPSKLELAEKLEQLRILENGTKIKVVVTNIDSFTIDIKEDLKRIKNFKNIPN